MKDDDWIPLSEAAKISGYHPNHVRRLLKSGEIAGEKYITVWRVSRKSLREYMDWVASTGTRGRPKKD